MLCCLTSCLKRNVNSRIVGFFEFLLYSAIYAKGMIQEMIHEISLCFREYCFEHRARDRERKIKESMGGVKTESAMV
jgi:hypothetical protein